eukprot:7089481-Lingulodinium_polyedra.AAC.1
MYVWSLGRSKWEYESDAAAAACHAAGHGWDLDLHGHYRLLQQRLVWVPNFAPVLSVRVLFAFYDSWRHDCL